MSKRSIACRAAALMLAWAASALAGPRDIVVLPVRALPVPQDTPVDLAPLAAHLEGVLREAVRDFGLTPLPPPPAAPAELDELALPALASDAWVLEPRLSLAGGQLRLRLAVVPHGSRLVLVRAEQLAPPELEVKSLGMLRELLAPPQGAAEREGPEPEPSPLSASGAAAERSEGKAVLALHTAALGGYVGFALQRASGSDEARLTYPLAALGAGIGVGAAMVVAGEWDIDVPRAWFLGAGMLWPAASTLLIVEESETPGQREMLGLLGSVGGVTLATAGLLLGDVSEGGAALTHSGAGFGLLLGGLTELAIEGDADGSPRRGLGWGALTGLLVAGAAATQLDVPSATDVLFVDLSALLGGLAGAALGTPVLVSQRESPTRDRIWLSGIIAGAITGATLSYWAAESVDAAPAAAPAEADAGLRLMPQLGWMGKPFGFGVTGHW